MEESTNKQSPKKRQKSHKFKLYAILSSMMKSLTLLSCSVLDVNLLFVQYVCVLNTSQISFWLHGLDDLESPKANYPPFEVSSEGQLQPNATSQCRHNSPHFILSHRNCIILHYWKKVECGSIRYFEHMVITFISQLYLLLYSVI